MSYHSTSIFKKKCNIKPNFLWIFWFSIVLYWFLYMSLSFSFLQFIARHNQTKGKKNTVTDAYRIIHRFLIITQSNNAWFLERKKRITSWIVAAAGRQRWTTHNIKSNRYVLYYKQIYDRSHLYTCISSATMTMTPLPPYCFLFLLLSVYFFIFPNPVVYE